MASINEISKSGVAEKHSASEVTKEEVVVKNMFTNAASATGMCTRAHVWKTSLTVTQIRSTKWACCRVFVYIPRPSSGLDSFPCAVRWKDTTSHSLETSMPSLPLTASTASFNRTDPIRFQQNGKRVSLMVPSAGKSLVCSVCLPIPASHCGTHNVSVTGYGVEKIGFRPFILGVLCYQCAVTTIFFVAPSIKFILLAECLSGLAFGVFMSSMCLIPIRVCSNKQQSLSRMLLRSARWLYVVI